MTKELEQPKLNPRQLAVIQRKNEIQQQEAELRKMLPPSIPTDKFIRTVQTAITLNPDLAECDKNSVLTSCMKAASDGLVLDGREAALVTYNVKKKDGTWGKSAQYIPMVAGIIKRVRNSGEVARLNAFVVHENDLFDVEFGLEMSLRHKPNFANPGNPMGAYAVCKFKDGETDFEFMSLKQIEGIRDRSKSKDKGPWQTDWSEMARKTVLRRLAKRLPVDSDLARVVERIDEDYDLKPAGEVVTPDADAVIDHETGEVKDKPPAKARGSAAAKLNPKPKEVEPEPTVIDNEPVEQQVETVPAGESEPEGDIEDIF
jgi:phage RecT family recombinase